MVVLRIAVLCGCGLALGGCLSSQGPSASLVSSAPLAVSTGALPPSNEPGRLLKPGLASAGGGVNPGAELSSSERARVAWAPLRPDLLNRPAGFAAQTQAPDSTRGMAEPSGTASVPAAARDVARRGPPQTPNTDAAMDRLEQEGRRDAKPICTGC
jgi:hypothetical protein